MILSDYLAAALLDHVFRGVTYTPPSSLWIALYTDDPTPADTGTEVTGYDRVEVTWTEPTDWLILAESTQTIFTEAVSVFEGITGEPAITHWGVRDADTAGNLLVAAPTGETLTVPEGGTLYVPAAAFVVTAF